MKLTAMRGDDAARVLCDLIEPASRILEDAKTADAFTSLASLAERKMPPIAMTMAAVMALRPIVKAHGGEMRGHNRPGGGAVFSFSLEMEDNKDVQQ